MSGGIAISRQWILVLLDGSVVVDWGNGLAVDLAKGEFVQFSDSKVSHPVSDDDLSILKRMGRVASFDQMLVYVTTMPEPPTQ